MIAAILSRLSQLHAAIRHDDRIAAGDDDDEDGTDDDCKATPKATVGNGATASDSPSYTPYRDRDSSAKKAPPLRVGAQGGGAWRFMDDYEKVEAGAYLEHVGGYKP